MVIFSQRLRMLREELDMTQVELAKALNISRSSISGYELDGKAPTYEGLCAMANFFDVTVDYLVGRSSERKNLSTAFPGDDIDFKTHYEELDESLRPVLTRCFQHFYSVLDPDVRESCASRLVLYEELFGAIARYRAEITKKVDAGIAGQNPLYVSELMALQEAFKTALGDVSTRLAQADIQAATWKQDERSGRSSLTAG